MPRTITRPISVDDAIEEIRAYARFRGWSMYRLAQEARIRETTLRWFWDDSWSPQSTTLRVLYSLIPADFDPTAVALPPPVDHRARNNGKDKR